MNTRQEDLKLLKKARIRLSLAVWSVYVMLCIWPIAVFFLLDQPLFPKPAWFTGLYLGSVLISCMIWLMIFFYLSTGEPKSRSVYWCGIIAEVIWIAWLFYLMSQDLSTCFVFILWMAFLLIKIIVLIRFGQWLKHSWWAQIFFDKVVTIYGPRPQKPSKPAPASQSQAASMQSSGNINLQEEALPVYPEQNQPEEIPVYIDASLEQEEEVEEEPSVLSLKMKKKKKSTRRFAAYPKAAIRLGVCVYLELMIFPILTRLFQEQFISENLRSVFALKLMFSLCILTAALWTIPVFFMYLKEPGCRKILNISALLQIVIFAGGLWMLYGYWKGTSVIYPTSAIVKFLLLDLVRYVFLIWAAIPAFKLKPIPREESLEDLL